MSETWLDAVIRVLSSAEWPLHYLEITEYLIEAGFKTSGRTPERTVSRILTTHPDHFLRVSPGTYAISSNLLSQDASVGRQAGSGAHQRSGLLQSRARGQGFATSASIRSAIELHAMGRALSFLQAQGWNVLDVSNNQPFDLSCRGSKGQELRVEVKGTTGAGRTVFLTANEVTHARSNWGIVALFVTSKIEIRIAANGAITPIGGTDQYIFPWEPRDEDLVAISFQLKLPAATCMSAEPGLSK